MGFLQAVHSLGVMASQRSGNSALADIMNFLQLPHPLGEAEDKMAHVIRIGLEVKEPEADALEVLGICSIDEVEYPSIGGGEEKVKERYLYRKPVGTAAQWSFSPVYKLGKGSNDAIKELLGKGWQNDKDSRFYKLRQRVLNDYEVSGCFAVGCVDKIMDGLVAQVEKIAEYWSDKKRSYLIVIGVQKEGGFLYPGEVNAFIKYFRDKLGSSSDESIDMADDRKRSVRIGCALCGAQSHKVETLDKVFKFATFDKESFLPGAKDGTGIREKVFPICQKCYALLSSGNDVMENRFANFRTVPGVNLYVIPEIISDNQKYYQRIAEQTRNFMENGIKHEQRLFDNLARHEEGLVYHFMFAEPNQAQLLVHFLIEDVPPSRLKQLQELWRETCTAFGRDVENDGEMLSGLDTVLRQIVAVLLSLSGKSEQDKMVMREKALALVGGVLNGDIVKTNDIKTIMVSRFAGLFTDPDWIKPKGKGELSGRRRLKGMAEVVDFLIRVNGRRKR